MKKFIPILSLFYSLAYAHPVIYKGGWVVSSSNMPIYSNNYLIYSFNSRLAAGVEYWRMSKDVDHNELALFKLNHLLWRENAKDSQANIYLHSGIGIEDREFTDRKTQTNGLIGLEADWETRTLYSSIKHFQFKDTSLSQVRVGFAPFKASFEHLQSWFMLQAMVMDEIQEKIMLTPMVRFFHHNVLWEMGSSTRGDWMLNLMVHY